MKIVKNYARKNLDDKLNLIFKFGGNVMVEEKTVNLKLVIFSGLMMAWMGSVIGLATAEMSKDRYQCCDLIRIDQGYSSAKAPRTYAIVGAILGLAIGSIQQTVRCLTPKDE